MKLYYKNVLFRAMKIVVEKERFRKNAIALSNYYYNAIGKCFMKWKKKFRQKKAALAKLRRAQSSVRKIKMAFLFNKMR